MCRLFSFWWFFLKPFIYIETYILIIGISNKNIKRNGDILLKAFDIKTMYIIWVANLVPIIQIIYERPA